jgi:hypothetical protein
LGRRSRANGGGVSATTNSIAQGTRRPGLPGRFVFVALNDHRCAGGEIAVMELFDLELHTKNQTG